MILFLIKVYALHFNQLFTCLSKRHISIAIYDRIAQRIEQEKRYENWLGQNYYVDNVSTTLNIGEQKEIMQKQGSKADKQSHYNHPGSFQSFLLLCKVYSGLWWNLLTFDLFLVSAGYKINR